MVGWHHWLNGHQFEQALRDGEGQGSLAHCSPWSRGGGHDWATEQQHTQNSLLGRLLISTSLCSSSFFKSYSLIWNFFFIALSWLIFCFISECLVGCLHLSILDKWPFVGDILCVPEVPSPLVSRAMCSRGVSRMDCVGPSAAVGWLLWVVW